MPNPFDMRGPDFLVFYILLGLLVTGAVAMLRRRSEPAAAAAGPLTDYLKIAYLRGGPDEALRVATLALIDRGLLAVVDEYKLKAVHPNVPAGLQRTEQRLLESFKETAKASDVLSDETLRITATTECEAQLVRAGLLPDDAIRASRLWLLMIASVFLGSVALLKILIALGRGRSNVGFLIVVGAVFGFVIYRVANPFRTQAGEAMLADLRMLFAALKDRAASLRTPSGGNDLPLLAAVFGIGSLPVSVRHVEKMFRKPSAHGSSSCGGSCGSSCGSSCGGGCGGGCGGCGS
jgi:uncharacterized protein (TIGR04222 family)